MPKPLKFGLYLVVQAPPGESARERLNELLEQARAARSYGFDTILTGQHFLSAPYQMLQPMPLLGRLAAETEGMRLGVGIALLPLLNPVAVAEEAASLDVICGGRFILGVGLGYRQAEDEAFGVARAEKAQRLEEALALIKALWTGEAVDYQGRFFQLKDARISVKPVQQPGPPIWMAATGDRAVTRAARLSDTWLVDPRPSLATLSKQLDIYRQALREAGKGFPEEFPIIRETYVAESDEEAFAEARPYLEAKYQTYTSWGTGSLVPEPLTTPLAQLAADRFIIGSPSRCIDDLTRFSTKLGVNHFILRMGWPGMKHSSIMKSLRMFGERVIPHFRDKT